MQYKLFAPTAEPIAEGKYSVKEEESAICLHSLESKSKGVGFGTRIVRLAAERALQTGKKLTTTAALSSHIFHLYMGFMPSTSAEQSYVESYYTSFACRAIRALESNQALEISDLSMLRLVLSGENEVDHAAFTLSMRSALKYKAVLLDLNEKKISTFAFFIERLIAILEKDNDKYPDTYSIGAVDMQWSPMGEARWREAIEKDIPFIPFRHFEHLTEFLTEDQRAALDSALEVRSHIQCNW